MRTVDFLKFLIAAWAMLSVVPFARQLAAQTSTRVEVSRLDGPVGSRVVVAVHVNEGGGSPRAAGLRGVLRYDPVGLRYVGQVPDRAQVALVNAGVAGAVELAAVPANPRVAPFGGRVAMLVFDVRATGAPAHVRFQTTEAVAGERLVRTTVRDDDAPPTVSAVLPSATLARVMSTDDWVRYVNTGSVDAPRATARGSAGVTVFRSPLQSSSLPCDAPCYGDTNLNGAISLEDGLAVVNWAIRASVLSSVASDSGIAGNVIPANVPGLGETGDSKIPGWDYVTGCYPQYTLSDGLEIVNYSVGLHDPDSSVVGRRIPSDRQKYPSGCTGAPSVSLTDSAGGALNLPGVIARDECIRIGLVAELSNECGDTRLVHALPRTRVLGRERAPMLTYTSQHARPTPGVTLDVRVPVGLAAPDSIVFKTTQNGAVIDSLSIPYMWWLNSTPNQKTEVKRVRIAWNAQSYATGIYPITITATAYYGATTHSSAVATDVIVVNRADSPYGSGWWLAGLDRIIVPSTGTRRLWVGGDGSARIFESVGSNLWVAAAFDRPDTLHFDGTQYERRVLGGGHERFDALGRHVTTVDPQGNTTTFAYQSSVADAPLTTLSVPRLGTPYTFVYQGSGASSILDRIEAPGTTGARIVEVTSSGRDIVSLRDPDLRQVQFMYTDGRVTARTDRRNTVTTLAYEQFGQLARAIVADGSGADTLFTCPAFQLSGTVCERQSSPPTLASLRVINARGISAFFYANAFGAARAVQTPDGTTTLTRGDPRFPAFVTRVDAPDQSIRRATADGRGNLASSTIQNALGDGLERTTTYTWDSQWDALTRITHPLGDFEEFGYDSFTGNLLFRGNGNGVAGRTTYRYGTSGNAATLLQGVTYPTTRGTATDRDSLLYDGLGNVTSLLEVTDSAGIGTRVNARDSLQHDAIGRLRSRCQEITIGSGLHQCTTTTFDAMSRDSVVTATGPALNNTPAQTLTVRNAFDAEGNVLSVQRQASDGTIGAITTSWLYDRWHRPTRETAPDNAQEFRYYDRAGNVDSVRTRRGHLIQMTYDGMNRLTRRVLPAVTYAQETPNWSVGFRKTQPYPWKPNAGSSYVIAADTTSFVYDNMGRMTRATNGDSRIGRSYLPNGALARDTLQIRATTLGGWLVYPLEHRYDANGRRTSLKQPTALVPDSLADSIRFRYDAITGNLDAVTDVLGNQFTFVDDLRQLPGALLMPNGHAQRWHYDAAGRVVADTVSQTAAPLRRATRFTYDARGRRLTAADTFGLKEEQQFLYSGVGHLVSSRMKQTLGSGYVIAWERPQLDALGNIDSLTTSDSASSGQGSFPGGTTTGRHYLRASVGRLDSLINSSGPHRYTYDLAGNTTWYQRGFQDGAEDRMSYYAADGQLRAADYRQLPVQVAPATLVFEQYRYDALGRRIWVRTDRACDSTLVVYASPPAGTRCNLSTLRRTVWDGTQELWEIEVPVKLSGDAGEQPASVQDDDTYQPNLSTTTQGHDQNPFFGRVLYVHGRVVDQPLGLTRFNYVSRPVAGGAAIAFSPSTYSLFWTQQGAVTLAACASGAVVPCTKTASGRTDTLLIASPAAIYLYRRDRYAPRSFMGTLVADKADAARTVYRRNRSYDPASGRFTQEDPIGLAGGMNLYGFAGGDPANFSDPFGLCPKDQGGDGRSTALGDCPIGSSGWAEFNRRASGRVADAGFGDPVFFLSGTARLAKSGLSGASAALVSLFSTGSISGASIIGIRSTLLTGGFKMGLAENRAGYLFTHSSGEVVRIMRRGGGWDLRVQNAAGNYLDDMGSVASPAKTHSIRVLSK